MPSGPLTATGDGADGGRFVALDGSGAPDQREVAPQLRHLLDPRGYSTAMGDQS